MIVRVINRSGLELPKYETEGSVGMDLRTTEDIVVQEDGTPVLAPTGIHLEIPMGVEGQIRPRSGLALRHGITVVNSPGTIDSDYRGEIKVILASIAGKRVEFKRGDRIAQLVFVPIVRARLVQVENLDETERGSGGFGSTGMG